MVARTSMVAPAILRSDKQVNLTNGSLFLCQQCLDDINRKNPQVVILKRIVLDLFRWQANINELMPDGIGERIREALGDEAVDAVSVNELRASARVEGHMDIEKQLSDAVEIVTNLDEWLQEACGGESNWPIASLEWTPFTLSISIGGECVWDDQVCSDEDLTFAYCRDEYLQHVEAVSKLLPAKADS